MRVQRTRSSASPPHSPLTRRPLGGRNGRKGTVIRTTVQRVLLCGVMLSAAAFLTAADSSANLLGRWRAVETSRGGIGTMFEFRKGGVVEYSPGAVVEMSYRVEGNELVLPPGTEKGPEQRQIITWLGD